MAKLKGTPVPDDFQLTELTAAWLAKRYPQIDVEIALERFLSWATNYTYQNHQRVFQGFINREADNNKLGPMLKKAEPKKDRGQMLIEIAKSVGFRDPISGEKFDQYEAAINDHKAIQASNVVQMVRGAMK